MYRRCRAAATGAHPTEDTIGHGVPAPIPPRTAQSLDGALACEGRSITGARRIKLRKPYIDFALVAGALAVTCVLLRPGGTVVQRVGDWIAVRSLHANWTRLTVTGIRVGNPSPDRVDLVEFSDYQCPYCRAAYRIVHEILNEHPNVALDYHPFPLPMHVWARDAALASLCAATGGEFLKLDRFLYENENWYRTTHPAWDSIAAQAGVQDTAAFERCIASSAAAARVDSSIALGRTIGVTATPTFATRDGFVHGPVTKSNLERALHLAARP